MSIAGEATVILSSLAVVGSFFWVPLLLVHCLRKCETWKSRFAVLSFFVLIIWVSLKAQRSSRHGYLWDKWHEYFDTKFVYEMAEGLAKDSATGHLLAMIPHGVYPFGAALSLVGRGDHAFGGARPVVVRLKTRN
jgi:hypothetical protein